MSYSFTAQPKVVKDHSRFKQDSNNYQQQNSDSQSILEEKNTFENLIKDKRIKMMEPVQQEQEYIRVEKERIKIDNMHKQLMNFKKVKKKMTPYDIKPSPNPRIEANLEFFLTDSKDMDPPQSTEVDTQTELFYEKPESPKYVPKKTGIDAETQVEDYELFNFDREVAPICNVIATKILEQSMLEIEEEEECFSMEQYKNQFNERRNNEKEKNKNTLIREVEKAKAKNRMLEQLKLIEQQEIKTFKKVEIYNISRHYLKNLKFNCLLQQVDKGLYQNNFKNQLSMDYQTYLMEKSFSILQAKQTDNDKFQTFISKQDQLQSLEPQRITNDQKIKNSIEQKEKRRWNNEKKTCRKCRILYEDQNKYPTQIAKFFQKFVEGTLEEYEKAKQARMEQLLALIDSGELAEEDFKKTVEQEFQETPQPYLGFFILKPECLSFTLSHNCFYNILQKEQYLELGCLIYDSEMNRTIFNKQSKNNEWMEYVEGIRDEKLVVRDDEAIVVRAEKLPENVTALLFYIKVPDMANIKANMQDIKLARYSLQDFEYGFELDEERLFPAYKVLEDMELPTPENPDDPPEQTDGYIFCYYFSLQTMANSDYPSRLYIEALRQIKFIQLKEQKQFFQQQLQEFMEQGISKDQEEFGMSNGSVLLKKDQSQLSSSVQQQVGQKVGQQKNPDASDLKSQEDENPEEIRFADTCFPLMDLDEYYGIEEMQQQAITHLKTHDTGLFESFLWGYDFLIKSAQWERATQIRRIKKLSDIVVVRKPEPEKPPEEEGEEEGEEEAEEIEEN